jgi:hypothetical protein
MGFVDHWQGGSPRIVVGCASTICSEVAIAGRLAILRRAEKDALAQASIIHAKEGEIVRLRSERAYRRVHFNKKARQQGLGKDGIAKGTEARGYPGDQELRQLRVPTEAKAENRRTMRQLTERGGKGRWSSRRS